MHALIEADGLTKKFGKVQALSDLTLTLPAGRPVAILGPNGAGKTTFVRMVATLIEPDRGSLRVGGHDVVRDPMAVRRMIGLAGQSAAVEEMMTGRENLVMVARLYGQGRAGAVASAERILEQMDLVEAADRLVKTYSGGMRRRLDLGASLVGSPRLLLLDEPTTGLDPGSRNEVWDAIRAMSRAGTDIVLTTQYLDEADHLAAYIVIIDGGRVIAQGTPDELKSRVGADMVELHTIDVPTMQRAAEVLASLGLAEPVTDPSTRRCSLAAPGGSKLLPVVVRALDDAAVPVEDIALRRPTLDEVFLALTGHTTTDTIPTTSEGGRSMTMDITLDPPRQAQPGGGSRQPGSVVSRRLEPGRGPDAQEVRAHPGADHRGYRAGGALPPHLPLRLRRRRGPHRGARLRGLPGAGLRRHRCALPGHGCRQRRGRRPGGRPLRPAAQPPHPAGVHHHRARRAPTRRSSPGACSS